MKRDYAAEGLYLFRVKLMFSCGVAYTGSAWAATWNQAVAMCNTDAHMMSVNAYPSGELIAQTAIKVS